MTDETTAEPEPGDLPKSQSPDSGGAMEINDSAKARRKRLEQHEDESKIVHRGGLRINENTVGDD